MIESISGIIGIINGIKNGLKGYLNSKKGKNRRLIIKKLVGFKLKLEEIIALADEILSSIKKITQEKRTPKNDIDVLRKKVELQTENLQYLTTIINDPQFIKIFRTFDQDLYKSFRYKAYDKKSRILDIHRDLWFLNASKIRKKYKDDYFKDGYNLLGRLKETSVEFSDFLSKHITIEDILN